MRSACLRQLYVHCWGGPEVNKFQCVSSLGHQMSLAGDRAEGVSAQQGPMSKRVGEAGARMRGGPCTVGFNA